MARQRPTRAPNVEIDRIVIREVQYPLEVNRCKNEEIIVKDNFWWVWPIMGGCPRIDLIVIRDVQYIFEVNRCRNEEIIVKCNFGWAWPMWAGRPRVGNGAMHKVQYQFEVNRCRNEDILYQFEVNRCRNEEIIVKGNYGWAWPMWVWPIIGGAPQVEIDRIVIGEVKYQLEVNRCRHKEIIVGRPRVRNGALHKKFPYECEINRCRNEEIIVKGNYGWAWPMWAGRPRIDRIVIRDVQYQFKAWPMWPECPRLKLTYQFEVNRCRNEEIIVKGNFGWAWPMWPGRPMVGNGAMHNATFPSKCQSDDVEEATGSTALKIAPTPVALLI
ncbi:hypothetical protein DPMN_104164 [Dreissena polymorpha]|uniref:Uncharacterized protein n=1 Tax=Dreissena polymorpha TaxID=45954 RepID=A0A9D4HBG3_DREPO|nr:hypothetical protein DPMN_104164 [Dreissena polymorpha]